MKPILYAAGIGAGLLLVLGWMGGAGATDQNSTGIGLLLTGAIVGAGVQIGVRLAGVS